MFGSIFLVIKKKYWNYMHYLISAQRFFYRGAFIEYVMQNLGMFDTPSAREFIPIGNSAWNSLGFLGNPSVFSGNLKGIRPVMSPGVPLGIPLWMLPVIPSSILLRFAPGIPCQILSRGILKIIP